MNEPRPKRAKIVKTTKRIIVKKVVLRDENAQLPIKESDELESFEVLLSFKTEKDTLRKIRLLPHKKIGSKTILLALVDLCIEKGLIEKSQIQFKSSNEQAGRKSLTIDDNGRITGKMKPLNKEVVETWNQGKEVEEIALILRPKFKNKLRQDFIARIKRILRTNRKLLLHPYRQ